MRILRSGRPVTTIALITGVAIVVAACGAEERAGRDSDGAAQPSTATRAEGLPAALAENMKQADQIVGEGSDAFAERLRALRGHPVVVNQWASWCTSCRFDFPFFAEAVERHRADDFSSEV